ncbi:MAG TPA: MATE family efflux transporter [Candidatus Paceibacterota bacterium]
MDGQDLTKGPIGRQLWSLAWPMMLSVFFYTLYNLVDTFWVSKISPEAIAAVSISQIALFIMIAFGFGLTVGSGVIMSMHIGAKDIKEAERVVGQAFVLAAIAGVFFTIISLVFRDFILTASGASGAIFAPALEYFIITAAGSVLFFILMTIMFIFNAQGDTFTLTKLFALSTLINCILDPIMIFGWLGFPALGIAGAAYATLISQAVFIVVSLRSLSSPHRMVRFHFKNLSYRWESVKKVLNIGFPASITDLVFPLGLAALTFLASLTYLEAGAIAFSLGFRIEFFAFLPAVGFGFGAMAMMGQNIGAGNMARAREAFQKALKYSFFGAMGVGVLAALLGGFIVGAFTSDPVVTDYTYSYLWTVALVSYGFLAAIMVEASAFQAIGRSWPGFWIFFLRSAVITTPLAYLFTQILHLPIIFMWFAIVLGNIVAAVAGYFWIRNVLDTYDPETAPVHADTHPTSSGDA